MSTPSAGLSSLKDSSLLFTLTASGVCVYNPVTGSSKLISHEDFSTTYNKFINQKKVLDGGIESEEGVILPRNCVFFHKTLKNIHTVSYYPAHIGKLNYKARGSSKHEVFMIPYPNILIHVQFTSGTSDFHVGKVKFWCTDLTLDQYREKCGGKPPKGASREKRIFIIPFSNMYDDGGICMGSNAQAATTKGMDLRVFEQYDRVFFDSFFNDDLGITCLTSEGYDAISGHSCSGSTVRKFYHLLGEEAKANREFPYHWLSEYTPLR